MPPSCKRGRWGGSPHMRGGSGFMAQQIMARQEVRSLNSLQWASRKKQGNFSRGWTIMIETKHCLEDFSMAWAHRQSSGPWWEVDENSKVTPTHPWHKYPCLSAGLWIPAFPISHTPATGPEPLLLFQEALPLPRPFVRGVYSPHPLMSAHIGLDFNTIHYPAI